MKTTKNELRKVLETLNKKQIFEDSITYCPTCSRGYLIEEEKEEIKSKGMCSACQYWEEELKRETTYDKAFTNWQNDMKEGEETPKMETEPLSGRHYSV